MNYLKRGVCFFADHNWGTQYHGFRNVPLPGAVCLRCGFKHDKL